MNPIREMLRKMMFLGPRFKCSRIFWALGLDVLECSRALILRVSRCHGML